ncbi:hypothetical protein EDC96DRAFT_553107 [Choanephora cucurbitarum]|nr:hypothetical protein EDC96DRAFT_553107 [Choanephora cucurbitarum]
MPTVLSELKQLRELDLSHNQLKGAITVRSDTIEVLDMSYNNISSIDFTGDSNLIKLNLSHNELEELPRAFRNWMRLQELNVSQNRLMYLFPAAVDHGQATVTLNSLVRLNASNNSILSLVERDSTEMVLPKLVELILSTNKLSEAGLATLIYTPQLQTLDISSNQLKDIPNSVMELTQLVRLDVRGNQLRTLSYELGKLDQLKIIYCEGNPMRSFTSMSPIQLIESLKSNYHQQQLQEQEDQQPQDTSIAAHHDASEILSQQLEYKVNLTQRLDLSNRKLTELPKQELQFQHDIPGTILLDHNELTLFPHSLCGLSDFIVNLVLDHNRLSNFSLSIEGVVFHQLKTLKLNNNRIKTLECSHHVSFPKLEELSLNHNALTTLSDDMADALPSLRVFSASSNKLDNLTEKPFGPKLEVIDLSNNDISALPSGLSTLSSLRELIVFGNRFRVPRPAIVDQGTGAVLEFLRRRHNPSA